MNSAAADPITIDYSGVIIESMWNGLGMAVTALFSTPWGFVLVPLILIGIFAPAARSSRRR